MAEAAIDAPESGAGSSAATQRRYVAYYRMSTPAQALHGFSLEAQQAAIANYVAANPGKLIAEYAETKSGRNNRRPKIEEAVQVCRIFRAVLLIARLDRLSRNVAMIAKLMESKVEFVATDFPHATRLTLHVLAAIAEHEFETDLGSRQVSSRGGAGARRSVAAKQPESRLSARMPSDQRPRQARQISGPH